MQLYIILCKDKLTYLKQKKHMKKLQITYILDQDKLAGSLR